MDSNNKQSARPDLGFFLKPEMSREIKNSNVLPRRISEEVFDYIDVSSAEEQTPVQPKDSIFEILHEKAMRFLRIPSMLLSNEKTDPSAPSDAKEEAAKEQV